MTVKTMQEEMVASILDLLKNKSDWDSPSTGQAKITTLSNALFQSLSIEHNDEVHEKLLQALNDFAKNPLL